MTSIVSTCNLALSNIGAQGINSLTEATPEARACTQFYDHCLSLLLQSYPWRFAGKTQSMAEVANTKVGQWGYAYQRPSDCVRVRWVRPQYSLDDPAQTLAEELTNPYDIEGDTIFCHLSPAFLRYTYKLVDPSKFSALFTEALSWHLSVRLAMPLTRDPKVRADAFQLAARMQGLAEMLDANEARENSDHDSEMVAVRS